MISQQRFDELVAMANKGGLHVREAINLAAHESVEVERARFFDLVAAGHLKRVCFKKKEVKNDQSTT
jgi:hypothetical protein